MKKKKIFIILIIVFIAVFCVFPVTASAETLNDNINGQLENLDLAKLEEYLASLTEEERALFGDSFYTQVKSILEGKSDFSAETLFGDVLKAFFSSVISLLPHFIIILAISVLCGIMSSNRSSFLSESTKDIIFYVSIISVIIVITGDFGALLTNTQNTIKKLTNLSEIMLPIIITLMIAGGGTASAALYRPAVAFLTNGISGIFSTVLMPLIGLTVVFAVLSNLSSGFKIGKMQDFISGVIKWVIGLSVTVFSFFMTAQGLTAANIDGISLRAAKYAITNSVPIVGGFLKDGFDLVLAGTILIKNAVGVGVVLLVFSLLLTPVLNLVVYQLLLKLFAALAEPVGDSRISSLLSSLSKSVSFLLAVVLAIGLMLFISLMLLIVSANAFI